MMLYFWYPGKLHPFHYTPMARAKAATSELSRSWSCQLVLPHCFLLNIVCFGGGSQDKHQKFDLLEGPKVYPPFSFTFGGVTVSWL